MHLEKIKNTGRKIFISFCFLFPITVTAQESDLLGELGEEPEEESFVLATFKGTRLINFHTVEVPGKRSLDFRINHHFGDVNTGFKNLWGLDGGASIRIGFDYSYDGRLSLGIGRSSFEKVYDGFIKYKLLRQTESNKMPITLTLFSGMYMITMDDPNAVVNGIDRYQYASSRLMYCHQVMIARKFNKNFSLQLNTSLVHYNLVEFAEDKNDLISLGIAGRYKFSRRAAITFEYAMPMNNYSVTEYFPPIAIGLDLETGGHVFQMYLTNSMGMIEPQFLGRNTSSWKDLAIKFGFNISRMFTVGKVKNIE